MGFGGGGFFFLGGGGGWVHAKKIGFKGGPAKKIWSVFKGEGGHPE